MTEAPLFARFVLYGDAAVAYATRTGSDLDEIHPHGSQRPRISLRMVDALTYSEDGDHEGLAHAEVERADGRVFILNPDAIRLLESFHPDQRPYTAKLWAANNANGAWT